MLSVCFQLEVYKSDFEAEQRVKNEVKAERDQLTDDLQHIQRRNQQLMEEIERIRGDNFVHVGREAFTAPSAPQQQSQPAPQQPQVSEYYGT